MKRVSVRETQRHFSRYVRMAEAGETIVIERRGKPVGRLVPLSPDVNGKVYCGDIMARLEWAFPDGPVGGTPMEEIVSEGRGEY